MYHTMKRIYLDNSATTSIDKRVEKVMLPYLRNEFGNPSALYEEGVMAKNVVEIARRDVAGIIKAQPDEVIFTGSGTESDNLAILGVIKAVERGNDKKPHIITSVIEHPAVFEVCKALERDGVADVTYVGVDELGVVDPKEVKDALRPETVVVSIMYANNEIGTVQPIREIAKVIRTFRKTKLVRKSSKLRRSVVDRSDGKTLNLEEQVPYFHTDACQATNYLDMNVLHLGVDLLTINGSKIYGPKGVGALYVKKGTNIDPIIYGGGQERGLRGGTENVSAIVGFAQACKITEELKEKETARLTCLRDYFTKKLIFSIPGSILNGDSEERLPNNVNISIPDVDSEQLVIELDAKGVSASARSACKSRDYGSSYVILALGRKPLSNEGGVRFSLGRDTKKKDIDYVLKVMSEIVEKMKNEIKLMKQL